jgi:hypothetical protein
MFSRGRKAKHLYKSPIATKAKNEKGLLINS